MEWGSLVLSALGSGVGAGLVAVLATLAVERFGGTMGGVLASIPTTIVPACIGWGSRLSASDLTEATAAVPAGMLVDAAVLLAWRYLPPALPRAWSSHARLAVVTAATLCVWALLALAYARVVGATIAAGDARSAVGAGGVNTALLVTVGALMCVRLPAPSGTAASTTRPTPAVLAARGCAAGCAIFAAVLLTAVSPVVGGLAATVPAIFTTTMVSLWLAHGEGLPLSATGPMVLGSSSVASYALMFAPLSISTGNAYAAAIATWLLAVALVSVPVARFLQWRLHVAAKRENAAHAVGGAAQTEAPAGAVHGGAEGEWARVEESGRNTNEEGPPPL